MQPLREARQLHMFDHVSAPLRLDARMWHGSFNGRESTLQQLSPYIGKLKSGMARVLIDVYSKPGEVVLDPFSGSGVVPLEAALAGRVAWANDLSPYAYALTRGKLETPSSEKTALQTAAEVVEAAERDAHEVDVSQVPTWVQEFFNLKTLQEIIAAFRILREHNNYFLISCLLGILHHQRPGFLSFPSSHLVPYVRKKQFPPDKFPQLYEYRDLRSRLLAKVRRAYRRHMLPVSWEQRTYQVWQVNSMSLPVADNEVDAIVSSPPYFGALDYARDNRLRLWFLGCEEWKQLDASLTANKKVYLPQMSQCIQEMHRVLRPGGSCVLVLGDVERDGELQRTAEILADTAIRITSDQFIVDMIYDDIIPDERRTRRRTQTTKFERILVMRKR